MSQDPLDKLSNNSKKVERNEKGQLLPGVVLNPKGKPKGSKHFSTLFLEALKREVEIKINGKVIKMKAGDAMVQAMVNKSIRGDVQAFNAVSDRVDGKPTQGVELEVTEAPVPIYNGKSIRKKKV